MESVIFKHGGCAFSRNVNSYVPQIDWFLIIELHPLISKNQKQNFVFFPFINKSKCTRDFNAEWHLFFEL